MMKMPLHVASNQGRPCFCFECFSSEQPQCSILFKQPNGFGILQYFIYLWLILLSAIELSCSSASSFPLITLLAGLNSTKNNSKVVHLFGCSSALNWVIEPLFVKSVYSLFCEKQQPKCPLFLLKLLFPLLSWSFECHVPLGSLGVTTGWLVAEVL